VAPYKFRIISGYRRYAACAYLKWETIPAIVHKLPLQLEELRFLNLIENINRQDLTSDEIAEVIRQLGSEGFTYKEIGIKLHKTTAWVRTYSLLNELSPRAAKLAIKNLLSQSAIEYVSAYPKDKQEALIRDKFTRPDRHLAKPVRSRKELREMAAYLHKINQPAEIRAISWMLNHLTTDQFLGSINESSSNVPNSI
jgi:ParB/RepB/Spo0J family partition protein